MAGCRPQLAVFPLDEPGALCSVDEGGRGEVVDGHDFRKPAGLGDANVALGEQPGRSALQLEQQLGDRRGRGERVFGRCMVHCVEGGRVVVGLRGRCREWGSQTCRFGKPKFRPPLQLLNHGAQG